MLANNKNKGKWKLDTCNNKNPFICVHLEDDEDFFPCESFLLYLI